jgi:hypothetical protein
MPILIQWIMRPVSGGRRRDRYKIGRSGSLEHCWCCLAVVQPIEAHDRQWVCVRQDDGLIGRNTDAPMIVGGRRNVCMTSDC